MSLKQFIAVIALWMMNITPSNAAEFSVVRQYVYPIVVTTNKTNAVFSTGSGVVIKEGYVVTAAHVSPALEQTAYVNQGGLKPARVVKVDMLNDLALLAVDVKCPCAPISVTSQVEIDATSYAVGFPLFLDYRLQILTPGLVQGLNNNNLITTTDTAPGGSGGGVFMKEKNTYKLIGMIKGVALLDIGPPVMKIGQLQTWFVISTRSTTIKTFLVGTPAEIK